VAASNLVNAEALTHGYGTRILLDQVSLGLAAGDVIGVVGRNGDGKTTLLKILTGEVIPDSGRVTRSGSVSIGVLSQAETSHLDRTVRQSIVGDDPDHVWAADSAKRTVVQHLLSDVDLNSSLDQLSGGERRRAALVALMLSPHDLLVLDEPTNHLDVEAVDWLARHLRELQQRGVAMLVVSHDRWFLDAVCNHVWEVHDAEVDAYDGGYAAYVLARAERVRQAAATESRRRNLLRKELAWLRRGPPARTSKPQFRIDAANRLIAGEPPPRDKLQLAAFSSTRLGKDVFDLTHVSYQLPDGRALLKDLSWSIGPGDRIGLVGVNGSGKTTLMRLLLQQAPPDAGRIKQGQTLRIGHLSQHVSELDGTDTVLDSVNRLKRQTQLATGREASTGNLLEDFGFTGDGLTTRIGSLSGGERRRLQLLRLLMSEPNVLLLDEPTNDLDIDTLNVIEDYLDTWPGTLIVITHDRYFLERVCDVTYALLGDGSCVLLPGGIDEYLERRRNRIVGDASPSGTTQPSTGSPGESASTAAVRRRAGKDMARLESQLAKTEATIARIHRRMTESAADHLALLELQTGLDEALQRQAELENDWLEAAESV